MNKTMMFYVVKNYLNALFRYLVLGYNEDDIHSMVEKLKNAQSLPPNQILPLNHAEYRALMHHRIQWADSDEAVSRKKETA